MSRLRWRIVLAAAVVVALVAAVLVPHLTRSSKPAVAATKPTEVVFVHGAGCGAIKYMYYAMKLQQTATGEPASRLHTVAYYACDTTGDSILNEGSSTYLPSPDHNGTDTAIDRIAYELAWYLWHDFGSKGIPVDLVGHSMGGVIIADALQHLAAHAAGYPRSPTVPAVVTFSSPLGGVPASLCAAAPTVECTELTTGSTLINAIDAAGAVKLGKTVWTAVGSDGADEISSASALALPGEHYRVDYSYPAYVHTGYLTDASAARNAKGTLNGVPFTSGRHSLELMVSALS